MVIYTKTIESLIGSFTEYGRTSLELLRLKAVDKGAGMLSAILPQLIVGVLVSFFFLFFNIGLALWLGQLLGQIYYGFFAVSGLYIVLGAVSYLFLLPWYRRLVCDYVIRQLMNNE